MSNPCYLPYLAVELLEHIAYYAASPLGPPASVAALQLTCRSIYNALLFSRDRPYLYDRIFRLKFDVQAPRRRLGIGILNPLTCAEELQRRCSLLQRIRNRAVASPSAREDLWLAYLMLLESDGRNARHLIEWAGLRDYALAFLVRTLGEERDNYGWPEESEETALAVWLLWMAGDEDSIRHESIETRSLVLRILQPFVIAPFKYQAAFVPDTHFTLPLVGSPASNPPRCITSPHGPFPVYRTPVPAHQPTVLHFGQPLTITAPPLTPAALLCIHVRRQLGYMQPPEDLLRYRSDLRPGEDGPTLEDYNEVNRKVKTRCISHASTSRMPDPSPYVEDANSNVGEDQMNVDSYEAVLTPISQRSRMGHNSLSWHHEHDWLRITHCYNPWLDAKIKIRIFTPGMIHGLWAGRMFAYDAGEYSQLSQKHRAPEALFAEGAENYPLAYQRPFYIRIREHHCLPEYLPIGWGQGFYERESDGLSNAYFPPGTEFVENRDAGFVRVFDPNTEEFLVYETYHPDRPNSHSASGGCELCRPRITLDPANDCRTANSSLCSLHPDSDIASASFLTPEQRKEAEQIFLDEGREDAWEDSFENGCINDIIITGETDYDHGRAWGSYRLYGRVRDSDGFIILLRFPEEPNTRGAGTYIFRGYIHSDLNFVGRWRAASEPADAFTAVEGNFSLCKMC